MNMIRVETVQVDDHSKAQLSARLPLLSAVKKKIIRGSKIPEKIPKNGSASTQSKKKTTLNGSLQLNLKL